MMRVFLLKRILFTAILLYLSSAILKIVGGFLSGSSALIADGMDSVINVFSSLFAYFSFELASKPADAEHPYGHYGFEVLSVIFTSIVMIIIGTVVVTLTLLRSTTIYTVGEIGVLYSFLSTVVILFAFLTINFSAKKTSSVSLKAEARHLSVDLLESLAVLISILLATYYTYLFDVVMAVGIGVLMYLGAAKNMSEIYKSIVYEIPSSELLKKIESIVHRFSEVLECHNLRIRKLSNFLFVDMHILVRKETSISQAHEIASKIEKAIKEEIPQVRDILIHLEPFEKEGVKNSTNNVV